MRTSKGKSYILKLLDDTRYRFLLDSDDYCLCDKVSGRRISSFRREDGLQLPFIVISEFSCEACQLAKHRHLSFYDYE